MIAKEIGLELLDMLIVGLLTAALYRKWGPYSNKLLLSKRSRV